MADAIGAVATLDPDTMSVTGVDTGTEVRSELPGISDEEPEDMDALKAFYGDLLQVDDEPVSPQPAVSPNGETAPVSEAVPAAETSGGAVTPAAEESSAPELLTDETRQLAEFGRQWQNAFRDNPQAAIAHLVQSEAFTPETRAGLIEQMQRAQVQPIALDQYEPVSDFERALMPNLDWLSRGRGEVSEAFAVRDKDIQHTYAEAAGAHALLEGLCEVLDIKLPKLDSQAVLKHYDAAPDGTLLDSVNKVYREAVLKAATAEKQRRAERPVTLRNQAPAVQSEHKINSLEDAWAEAGRQLGMEA